MKSKKHTKPAKDDLMFYKGTEEAWKRYKKGEFISMDYDDF